MKNTAVLLFLLFSLSHKVDSQGIYPPLFKNVLRVTTVDSGNIRILYALNATDIKNPETYYDLQRLEIGDKLSKYYSYLLYKRDSLSGDMDGQVKLKDPGKWSERRYSEYFKDFSINTAAEYVQMPWGMPNFQYSEDISLQNWELHDDTLSVGGYLCQKATCNFRGRNYTSWFTVDIPVSNGPWKFGGLPGLILKVYDDDNLYTFECVSIENYPIKYPIQMYDAYKNYSKTEHKKFLKLLKNVYADYFTAAGIISLSDNINKSVPFHPLELE